LSGAPYGAQVAKAFNLISATPMVAPPKLDDGAPDMFIAGNDAKATTADILKRIQVT
jgi:predicted dinucleotide-binding enzyme